MLNWQAMSNSLKASKAPLIHLANTGVCLLCGHTGEGSWAWRARLAGRLGCSNSGSRVRSTKDLLMLQGGVSWIRQPPPEYSHFYFWLRTTWEECTTTGGRHLTEWRQWDLPGGAVCRALCRQPHGPRIWELCGHLCIYCGRVHPFRKASWHLEQEL